MSLICQVLKSLDDPKTEKCLVMLSIKSFKLIFGNIYCIILYINNKMAGGFQT